MLAAAEAEDEEQGSALREAKDFLLDLLLQDRKRSKQFMRRCSVSWSQSEDTAPRKRRARRRALTKTA